MSTPPPEGIPLPQLSQQRLTGRNVIDRMPVEVLAYIFQLYIEPQPHGATNPGPWVYPKDVLPLGAVCQRWRTIAWESPPLWNSLRFEKDHRPSRGTPTEQTVQLAIEWLGRSGGLPLAIYFGGPRYMVSQPDLRLLAPLADVVGQVLHRCRYLTLSYLDPSMLARIFPERPYDLPCVLRKLKIKCRSYNLSEPFPVMNLATAAPFSLSIKSCILDRFAIDWSNLTEFYSTFLYLKDTFKVLALASRLVKVRLLIRSYFVPQETHNVALPGTSSLLCANVQNIYLDAFDDDARNSTVNNAIVSTFLESLTLPNLTVFGIQHSPSPPFPIPVFLDLVRRSRCAITELSLNKECISVDDLVLLARCLPSVTSFSFHLSPEDTWTQIAPMEDLLRVFCLDARSHGLGLPPVDDMLFPNLKHILVASIKPLPLELLPGLKWRYSYSDESDGTRRTAHPGRPRLESISALFNSKGEDCEELGSDYAEKYEPSVYGHRSVPDHLIQDWEAFDELWQLAEDVRLDVGIWPDAMVSSYAADVFALSYRILPQFVGEPPEHIKKSWEAKKRPVSWIAPILSENLA